MQVSDRGPMRGRRAGGRQCCGRCEPYRPVHRALERRRWRRDASTDAGDREACDAAPMGQMRRITGARVTQAPDAPWIGIEAAEPAPQDGGNPPTWWLTIHNARGLPPAWAAADLAVDGGVEDAYLAAEEVLSAVIQAADEIEATRQRLVSRLRRGTAGAQRAFEMDRSRPHGSSG
jgi:hypothetical protein